jgi:MFS superfamily sulfate permease-like transporter
VTTVCVLQAISKIPRPTLAALLSIQGVDSATAVAQMKALAAQDKETIAKLVFFTTQVSCCVNPCSSSSSSSFLHDL